MTDKNLTKQENSINIKKYYRYGVLDLSNMGLSEIPDDVFNLKNLISLKLSNNKIAKLPDKINELDELLELDLSKNHISNLNFIGEGLEKLTSLDLSNNSLYFIPDQIENLTNLMSLALNNNKIHSISRKIGKLHNLLNVNLMSNRLKEIPFEICNLKHLNWINLSNNFLKSLPKDIYKIESLTVIFISNNNDCNIDKIALEYGYTITSTSYDFLNKYIVISENDYKRIPKAVTEAGNKSIYSWFGAKRDHNLVPINEARVIFLGSGGAGKTSLINFLVGDRFNDKEMPTKGIEIRRDKDDIDEEQDRGVYIHSNIMEAVKFNYWDFGGQDIYHTMHKLFLSSSCIYVVVLDARRDDVLYEKWFEQIKIYGDSAPTFVVINQIDLSPHCDIDMKTYKKKYPFIIERYLVSCKTEEGLNNFVNSFKSYILKSDKFSFIRQEFSSMCVNVKEQIEQIEDNYLTLKEYRLICHNNNVSEEDGEELLKVLNNIGIVKNLYTSMVLKSKWITKAAYKIIDYDTNKYNSNGGITIAELNSIFDELKDELNEKPNIDEIINLICKFNIGYLYKDQTKLIIPRKIFNTPENYEALDKTLDIVYEYPYLDISIFHRAIVGMNYYIYNNIVWCNGAILLFKECDNILVEMKIDEYYRRIYVKFDISKSCYNIMKALDKLNYKLKEIHHDIFSNDSEYPKMYISLKNTDEDKVYDLDCNQINRTITIGNKQTSLYSLDINSYVNSVLGKEFILKNISEEKIGEHVTVNNIIFNTGDGTINTGDKNNIQNNKGDNNEQKIKNQYAYNESIKKDIENLRKEFENLDDEIKNEINEILIDIEEFKNDFSAMKKQKRSSFLHRLERVRMNINDTASLITIATCISNLIMSILGK